jgi:hypothetical protein
MSTYASLFRAMSDIFYERAGTWGMRDLDEMGIDLHPPDFAFEDTHGDIGTLNVARLMTLHLCEVEREHVRLFDNEDFCIHYRDLIRDKFVADRETRRLMNAKDRATAVIPDEIAIRANRALFREVIDEMRYRPRNVAIALDTYGEEAFRLYGRY